MHAEPSLSRVGVVASRQLAIINPTRIHERGLFILNHGEGGFLATVTETATSRDWASLDYAGGLENSGAGEESNPYSQLGKLFNAHSCLVYFHNR